MSQTVSKSESKQNYGIRNYLTIDVEEYFQVAAFENIISPEDWDNYESRVVRNTRLILELLDKYSIKATFFIVGWTAERQPGLVREVAERGHEIGCHSYRHQKIYNLTPDEFRQDTSRAKDILEQISGQPVYGYRAPSYSITTKSLWALEILQELGFQYDSSIFPVVHDNYGIPDAPRFSYRHVNVPLTEYPISTVRFIGLNIPIAGGGYFRLSPYWFTRMLLKQINVREKKPFIFYLHPWEMDPAQPRIQNAKWSSRFRHYNNLDKTASRFESLLQYFEFGPVFCS